MTSRTQRYRLLVEFELRDRSDYALARRLFHRAIGVIADRWTGIHIDYIAIEKVERVQIEQYNRPIDPNTQKEKSK